MFVCVCLFACICYHHAAPQAGEARAQAAAGTGKAPGGPRARPLVSGAAWVVAVAALALAAVCLLAMATVVQRGTNGELSLAGHVQLCRVLQVQITVSAQSAYERFQDGGWGA